MALDLFGNDTAGSYTSAFFHLRLYFRMPTAGCGPSCCVEQSQIPTYPRACSSPATLPTISPLSEQTLVPVKENPQLIFPAVDEERSVSDASSARRNSCAWQTSCCVPLGIDGDELRNGQRLR
jgi:hypothetical protein